MDVGRHHVKRHKAKLHRATRVRWQWSSWFRPNNVYFLQGNWNWFVLLRKQNFPADPDQ